MSKIGRFLGNVKAFASEALGTERTIFGSTAQSNALTDQINALYRRGWAGVSATETPTYQDFNALGYTLGQFIAYLHQMGIAEYHAQQEYYKGTVVIFDGNLYQAVKDSPSGQPVGNTDNWYSFKSDIDSKADATYVNTHVNNKSNPHAVTKAQVGLGNVPNWSEATFDGRYDAKGTASGLAIGVGQTWQDVTGSRAAGTTYTNTTGRPIEVAVSFRQSGGNNEAQHTFNVNGVAVGRSVTRYGEGEKASFTSAIVPEGASYSTSSTKGELFIWAELR